MRLRWWMIILGASLAAPAVVHAENCAQLNAATAGGLMGVEVSLKMEHVGASDTVCTFTPIAGADGGELRITVHALSNIHEEYRHYAEICGKDAFALRAVGNEAIECSLRKGAGLRVETVVGRVRDRAFTLAWTIPNPEQGVNAVPEEDVREKLRNVAEQVAGSMF